jgi:iron(III) transport system ATP-binding protein
MDPVSPIAKELRAMKHLELTSVSKSFGATRAVDGVSLELGDGKRLAVVGPSGCGKTTLLRLIAGFEFPDAGTISLDGETISSVPAFRRGIGYLPQEGSLFPHLTVENNIGFGLRMKGRERAKRIRELMDLVSLDSIVLKRWPHELSGGQQQRVALARALALSPRLMLLDEPFSALDANLRAASRVAIAAVLQAAGISTILVTHDRAEALSFPDELAVMNNGRIVGHGSPANLFRRPRDAFIAELLGDAVIVPATLAAGRAQCIFGSVPVDDERVQGPAKILLRPEQLQLAAQSDAQGAAARVEAVEYTGHLCTAKLRLDHLVDAVAVRCSAEDLPAVGVQVRVYASAIAHVLLN